MKKLVQILLVVISTFTGVFASSLQTAVITYRHLDALKYEVTVKAYRNCAGIALSSSQPIYALCKNSSTKIALNINLVSIKDVTPNCPTQSKLCYPANTYGTGNGTEEHTFIDTVDLNSSKYAGLKSCGEIIFEYAYCCRPSSITNLDNSNFYTYAYLNRNYGEGNSSPQINMPPVQKLCCNQPFYYNVGAIDTFNSDSISYSFDEALENFSTAVKYRGNFSKDYPISVYYPGSLKFPYANTNASPPIGLYLDPETGDLIFSPTQCNEQTVAVIKLTEWRKDSSGNMQVIGITRQELLLTVQYCTDNNPPIINGAYYYKVCAGEQICFNITSDDKVYSPPPPAPKPAPDTVSLFWNAGIKGATFTIINPKALHQSGRFCWTPNDSDSRSLPYQFTVEARDNACPINAVSRRSCRVEVKPRAKFEITKRILSCNQLEMKYIPHSNSSLSSYFTVVKDSTGNVILDRRVFQFNSSQNVHSTRFLDTIQFYKKGKYFVEYKLNNKPYDCPVTRIDSIIIASSFDNLVEVEDTFFCASTSLSLTANALVSTSFTHPVWHTGNAADTNFTVSLWLNTPITQLQFSAIDKNGCEVPDFVTINRVDIPSFYLGNDTFICSKNQILLKGPKVNGDPNLPNTYAWQDASIADSFVLSQSGKYWLTVTNTCGSTSDTIIVSTPTDLLQPTAPIHFCEGKTISIQSQLKGYQYRWHDAGLGNKFTANITKSGNYNCDIILTCGDTLTETIEVIAEQTPNLFLPDTLTYCEGTPVKFAAGTWDKYTQVLWNDNSQDSIKKISSPGVYTFSAINVCGVFWKTMLAIEDPLPKIDLGKDMLYCNSFTHSYDFSASKNNFLWSDNSQSKIKIISQPGDYWLRVNNNCGAFTDTIHIEQSFVPQVNLGRDTALKLPFSLLLDAENSGASYVWSNNDTFRTLLVTNFGTYWVKVTTPCGVATDSITITDAAGNEKYHIEGLKIYPNPTSGQLTISSSFAAIQNIKVFNVLGETLLSSTTNGMNHSITLDLSPLANGIYYVKIYFENGRVGVYNIVKNR